MPLVRTCVEIKNFISWGLYVTWLHFMINLLTSREKVAELYQKIKTKKNETFIVRSCHLEDIEDLQIFFQKGAIESTHTLVCKEREQSLSKLKEKVETALNAPSEIYLCVFDKGQIIGNLHLRAISPEHPWIKHIAEFGMIVSADYWGQGIGHALLEIMEDFAKKIGISKVEAKVRVSNERGLSLYKKNGYTIEGTRKKAAFINGQFEDEFFIAKFLQVIEPK
jgi:RimJ/RimL family protein N-acetyltransferase